MCEVEPEIEKAASEYRGRSPLCIASVQTLQRDRLERFDHAAFDTVIVGEAHHSVASSYVGILNHFEHALTLGVTATPDRADRRGLADIYDSIAYEYGIARAVKDGYLCRIRAKFVPLEIDISKVRVSRGDFQASDLGNALDEYIPQIASVMARECADRKTVVFCPLVATSEKVASALCDAGLSAVSVSGYDTEEERREKIAAFERGGVDVLCNSMLLTEGWDCPSVDCIVVLRPTKSRPLYAQMVGRGTRTAPGKDHLLLLDFLWMTERHDLCRPATLLGKSDDVAELAQEKIRESDEEFGLDLIDVLDDSEADVQEQRENALAEQLAAQRRRKKKLVDPLQYAISIMDGDLTDYRPIFAWEKSAPTQTQLEALEKFQIDTENVNSRGMASALIGACVKRIDGGLSTPKQIRFLEGKGYEHVGTWTKEQASVAIGRISANGWRVPYDIRPGTFELTTMFTSRAKGRAS